MEFKDSPNQQRVRQREAGTVVSERTVPAETVVTEAPVAGGAVIASEPRQRSLFRAELIVWYILGVIEVFLGVRLILALLNVTGTINNQSGFARFVYDVADPLAQPFYGLFNTTPGGEPGVGVIITAMLVYALVGWGIARLLRIGRA